MIDEMRPNIEENTRAGAGFLTPGPEAKLRTKAIVVRFKADDASQRAARNELPNRLEIAVVTAILVNTEHSAVLPRKVDERNGFVERGGEGLVDKHIASRSKTLAGDWEMGIVRRSDNDETNFRNSEEFVERAHEADIGILRGGLVAAALQNRGEAQSRHARDYLCVKRTSGKPKSDETYVDHKKVSKKIMGASNRDIERRTAIDNASEEALHTIASLNGNDYILKFSGLLFSCGRGVQIQNAWLPAEPRSCKMVDNQ